MKGDEDFVNLKEIKKQVVNFSSIDGIKTILGVYSDSLHCLEFIKTTSERIMVNSEINPKFLQGKVSLGFDLEKKEGIAFINTGFGRNLKF